MHLLWLPNHSLYRWTTAYIRSPNNTHFTLVCAIFMLSYTGAHINTNMLSQRLSFRMNIFAKIMRRGLRNSTGRQSHEQIDEKDWPSR